MSFYDIFLKLCNDKKKSVSGVCEELGINKSNASFWKQGRSKPTDKTLLKIAEYFDVDFYALKQGHIRYMQEWPDEDGTIYRVPGEIEEVKVEEESKEDNRVRQAVEFSTKYAMLTDNQKKLVSELIDTLLEKRK